MTVVPAAINPPDARADIDYGNGCVLYTGDRLKTVDSLRDHCTWTQQDQIFLHAEVGAVPHGQTDGWVARPPIIQLVAPVFWEGKTFATGPDGGTLTNRVTPLNVPGFPANVYRAPERIDGQPAWILDYAPSITPQILDEIREVTPGVWFGYSWWRGFFQTTLLLTFVLTEPV
jgi:hypothetical protein